MGSQAGFYPKKRNKFKHIETKQKPERIDLQIFFEKSLHTHIFELKTKIDKNKSKYHCFFSFELGSNSEPKF